MKEKNELNPDILKFAEESLEHEAMMADRENLDFEIHNDLLNFGDYESVLPMYISKSENTPATEVIVCSAISGGVRDANKMPKELTITRKLLNGEEYKARYVLSK